MTANSSPIVVGYDGSPDAERALEWAADLVRTGGEELALVMVTAPVRGDADTRDRMPADGGVASATQRAQQRLDELGVSAASVRVEHGSAAERLTAAARDARMLVVGSRGHSRLGGALVGSVSQHLVTHAPGPVIVVRPAHEATSDLVIVGLSGSPASARALRFACDFAGRRQLRVHAVYGFEPDVGAKGSLQDEFSAHTARDIDEAEAVAKGWADQALAGQRPVEVDIEIEPIAVPPARLLVDCSTAATLVVVGSPSRSAPGELLRPVAQQVLHRARCPVALIP